MSPLEKPLVAGTDSPENSVKVGGAMGGGEAWRGQYSEQGRITRQDFGGVSGAHPPRAIIFAISE